MSDYIKEIVKKQKEQERRRLAQEAEVQAALKIIEERQRDAAKLRAEIREAQCSARAAEALLAPVVAASCVFEDWWCGAADQPLTVMGLYADMLVILTDMAKHEPMTEEAALELRAWQEAIEKRIARIKAREGG